MKTNEEYRSCNIVFRELCRKQWHFNNPSDTFYQLFLISLIVVARLMVARGAGVHQWNLPMQSYIGLRYVSPLVHQLLMFGAD